MTLVLASSCDDDFVAISGDSMTVYFDYCIDTADGSAEKVNENGKRDTNGQKVDKLSDYVLFGHGGVKDLAISFMDELKARIKPNYALRRCKAVVEEVIKDFLIRAQLPGRLKIPYIFLNQEYGLDFYMLGFYREGGAGGITYQSGPGGGVLNEIPIRGRYYYGLITPVEDYLPLVHQLFDISPRDKNLQGIHLQMMTIHSTIAKNHPDRVSPDMNTYILKANKKHRKGKIAKPEYIEHVFDTSKTWEEGY